MNANELVEGNFEMTLNAAFLIRLHQDGTFTYVDDTFRGKMKVKPGTDMVFFKSSAPTDTYEGAVGIGFTNVVSDEIVDMLLRVVTPRAGFWKPWRMAAKATKQVVEYVTKVGGNTEGNFIDLETNGRTLLFDDDMNALKTAVYQDPDDPDMDILEVQ